MVYHETQKYQYCAVHAVNALLGYPAFSVRDFEQVARQLGKELGDVVQQHSFKSILGLGDYDVNVIGRILETKELEIHWQDRRVTVQLDGLLDPKTVGLLINVCIRRWWRFWGTSRHWCALKREEDKFYWLDSFLPSPIVWTELSCVEQYLQRILCQQDGQVLWIRRRD